MSVYRGTEDLPKMVSEIRKDLEEIKTRQFIGSNQMVMRNNQTGNTWDITVTTNGRGQTVDPPYWAAFTIDAVSSDADLVADLFVKQNYTYVDAQGYDYQTSIMPVPLPVTEGKRMKWIVVVLGDSLTRQVSAKISVIANTNVSITVQSGIVL